MGLGSGLRVRAVRVRVEGWLRVRINLQWSNHGPCLGEGDRPSADEFAQVSSEAVLVQDGTPNRGG